MKPSRLRLQCQIIIIKACLYSLAKSSEQLMKKPHARRFFCFVFLLLFFFLSFFFGGGVPLGFVYLLLFPNLGCFEDRMLLPNAPVPVFGLHHYENMSVQYAAISKSDKNDNF